MLHDTYAFTVNLVPLVLEETCFAGHTFEYKWKTKKKVQFKKRNVEMRKGVKGESPPTRQTWAKHRRGGNLGLARSPLEKGGGERSRPGCGRTTPSPSRPHFALAVAWRHA